MANFLTNKIAKNASWIIISRIFQAILSLVIGMIVARFLGPSNYGLINYAQSVVTFVVPIMNLGFSNVLVQELTNHPEDEGKVLGTSIFLSFLSSLFCIFSVLTYSFIFDAGETTTHIVIGLYSLMLIAQAAELIKYWYQAKLLSKYAAIISLVAYSVVSIYKIFLLINKASVHLFAISNSIDYALIAIALYFVYRKLGGQKFTFSSEVGKRMFEKSKHYIISSMMVVIFAQTDKIMLKIMISEEAVGYYSAAITCAGITSFVFTAIIDSFRPVIFERKKQGNIDSYETTE